MNNKLEQGASLETLAAAPRPSLASAISSGRTREGGRLGTPTLSLTLTVPEAAQLLGISRGSAYAAAKRGELPTVTLGRRCLVPRASLMQLLGHQEPVRSEGTDVLEGSAPTT